MAEVEAVKEITHDMSANLEISFIHEEACFENGCKVERW